MESSSSGKWDEEARALIQPGSDLVDRHLQVLEEMVRIDSRSFNVGEFEGDRQTPSDMQEILECAKDYLCRIGFPMVKINQPPPLPIRSTSILLAEIFVSKDKPTVLFYAHLDKQPYMDDEKFLHWGGVPPTQLRWNEDRTRAYGRGAADDLSGVIAIGMAVDAVLQSIGYDPDNPSPEKLAQLPCNFKVIYETEEECGSHSLIDQIKQNQAFFEDTDCVLITDVINPAQGVPGLTTSLRGIVQLEVTLKGKEERRALDDQTALYKLLAGLIREDHALAVAGIAAADHPVKAEEEKGYAQIPTTVEILQETAGVLPGIRLTVADEVPALLIAQLRKSFVNIRPGHRISGSVIFGAAGARLAFPASRDAAGLKAQLQKSFNQWNPFNLKVTLRQVPDPCTGVEFDLIVQAATKDPHSGINGGPFPVAELQLARMIDRLVQADGKLHPDVAAFLDADLAAISTRSLFVDNEGRARPFENSSAKAIVEIRLAPGNEEKTAMEHLQSHLKKCAPPGFEPQFHFDKGASPWMTEITHPVFPLVLQALETGFGETSCLYGCGGSIPFVAKLTSALGNVQPICLGAYDPDCRMHEPGESLSMPDLLGCARSMVHIVSRIEEAFPSRTSST